MTAASRRYAYRFLNSQGEEAASEVEAFSRAEALGKIRAKGRLATSVDESLAAGPARAVSSAATEFLAGQLGRLLSASVPLERALELIAADDATPIGAVATAIRGRLRTGATPFDAFAASPEAFDRAALALIRAGESSGDLAGAFTELEKVVAKQNVLRARIRSALIYPSLVLTTAVGATMMILLHVIPEFEDLVADNLAAMPFSARLVFGVSRFLRESWPAIAIATMVFAVVLVRAAAAGRLEAMAIGALSRVPLFAPTLKSIAPARLARLLGALLARNVPLMEAFDIASASVTSPGMAAALAHGRLGLQQGQTLRAALAGAKTFPPLLLQMLQIGEETGRTGPMLLHAADLLDERVDRSVQRFLILSQPILLIVMGLVVGSLLYGLFSAILAINNTIG